MDCQRGYLSEDELYRLATAGPGEKAADLARELNRLYATVAVALRRIRANGWGCKLYWTTCVVCGRPTCHGQKTRRVHPLCKRERVKLIAREFRRRNPGQSTPYVRKYLAEHPEKVVEKRLQGLQYSREKSKNYTREQWQELIERVHHADRRDQTLTVEVAESKALPWRADEDQYVLDHMHDAARDVALALRRTLWAVRSRKMILRRRLGLPVKRSRYE